VAPDGTGERVLVRVAGGRAWVAWSTDSRFVHYFTVDESGVQILWAVPVAQGPPRRLMTFDRTMQMGQGFAVRGTKLYLMIRQEEAGLWIAELSEGR
jgi:hypothetical protein